MKEYQLAEEPDFDDNDMQPMTDEEMEAMKAEEPVTERPPAPTVEMPVKMPVKTASREHPGKVDEKQLNVYTNDRILLYTYDRKEAAKVEKHLKENSVTKVIFYMTISKEEYKELTVMTKRNGTRIIGSGKARVI